jgi:hypothetical protein
LLGGQKRDSADGGAGSRQQIVGCDRRYRGNTDTFRHTANRAEFGQAKIEDFGVAALGDEQVGRFDVAVHDPFRVRGVQRVGDLDSEFQHLIQGEGLAGDDVLQRLAVYQTVALLQSFNPASGCGSETTIRQPPASQPRNPCRRLES